MSKSLNNFYKIKDLEERGFKPLSYRLLVLSAHYQDKLNFTWQSLEASQNSLRNLYQIVRTWPKISKLEQQKLDVGQFWQKFIDSANNNLNMPQALSVFWSLVKSDLPDIQKAALAIKMDSLLGLGLEGLIGKKQAVPKKMKELLKQREMLRKKGDFKKADEIRKRIEKSGYLIKDTLAGPELEEGE